MIFLPQLTSHNEDAGPSSFKASSLYLPVKRFGGLHFSPLLCAGILILCLDMTLTSKFLSRDSCEEGQPEF